MIADAVVAQEWAEQAASRTGRTLGASSFDNYPVAAKVSSRGLVALLQVKSPPGQTRLIPNEVLEALKEQLNQPQGFNSYGEIVEWIEQEHNILVKYKTVYRTAHYGLGAKLKVPRPHSTQQDEQAVETFKKYSPSLINVYLCQDQTRAGLKSETRRVITARRVKPVAAVRVETRQLLDLWGSRATERMAV